MNIILNSCVDCPFLGVVDIDNDGNLIWSCTRLNCVCMED